MNIAGTIVFANLVLIGALPLIFFRRDGRFGAMWWATGAPFFVTGGALLGAALGVGALAPGRLSIGVDLPPSLAPTVSALLAAVSIGFISFTLGTHRTPVALWHQRNDTPIQIVTWGAYRRIRHPFYASFLLTQTAAVLALPNAVTVGALLYTIGILSYTARREERRLLASELGKEYRSYMIATGRFVPGFGRGAAQ